MKVIWSPTSPTSPGENARVLPPSHPPVAEEQILQPMHRSRQLFADSKLPVPPSVGQLLAKSIQDLEGTEELRELGVALFLDRPFGAAKATFERDQTPLLATQAFSPRIAQQRLAQLAEAPWAITLLDPLMRCKERLDNGEIYGLSFDLVGGKSQVGKVSLCDAREAARDFVLVRTTSSSVAILQAAFDFTPLAGHLDLEFLSRPLILATSSNGRQIAVYDGHCRPLLLFEPRIAGGYVHRRGCEYPADGLQVVQIWKEGIRQEVEITIPVRR